MVIHHDFFSGATHIIHNDQSVSGSPARSEAVLLPKVKNPRQTCLMQLPASSSLMAIQLRNPKGTGKSTEGDEMPLSLSFALRF